MNHTNMYEWTIVLSFIVACCTAYYWCSRRNYFEDNGIIYIKLFPILGTFEFLLFPKKTIWEYFDDFYKVNKVAKYIGFHQMNTPVIFIRDPELIKTITIKNFDHFVDRQLFVPANVEPFVAKNLFVLRGDKWREMRNLLSPAFTSSKMKAMFRLMSDCADNFANYLTDKTEQGLSSIDSKDAFSRYTSDVIATCAFGVSVDSMRNPNNEFYVLGRDAVTFGRRHMFKVMLMAVFPKFTKLFGIRLFGKKIEDFFTQLVENTVETRDREGIVRPDMIQLMMESRKNESSKGSELTIEDMTAQAFIFFLGGFETTATLMCFIAHLISIHPHVQNKLQEEVDEVYEKCCQNVTYDAINNMPYLDAVINETMRLYPVGPPIDRVCAKTFELPPALPGKKSLVLKPGALLSFSNYSIQRDPQYFSNAEKFSPDRFIEDPGRTLHSSAFLPFGMGPRMCIGNRFALLEIKVLLFHLIVKCSLTPGDDMMLPLKLNPSSANMTPMGGFWLKLQPRNKWQSITPKITL